MRIAILSPEAVPFAKVGGLADVSSALNKALRADGVDSLLILPLYDSIDRSRLKVFDEELGLFWRGKAPRIRVWQSDELAAPTYFIAIPINLPPMEIMRRVDEVSRRSQFIALPDTNPRGFAAPEETEFLVKDFQPAAINGIVERKNQKRINAVCAERFVQRAGNIREPADFSEG